MMNAWNLFSIFIDQLRKHTRHCRGRHVHRTRTGPTESSGPPPELHDPLRGAENRLFEQHSRNSSESRFLLFFLTPDQPLWRPMLLDNARDKHKSEISWLRSRLVPVLVHGPDWSQDEDLFYKLRLRRFTDTPHNQCQKVEKIELPTLIHSRFQGTKKQTGAQHEINQRSCFLSVCNRIFYYLIVLLCPYPLFAHQ